MAAVAPAVPHVPDAEALGRQGLQRCLTICGCSADLRDAIIAEGVTQMINLKRLTNTNIDHMAKRITGLPLNRGGARFGEVYINNFKALCLWTRDRAAMGLPLNGNVFDDDILGEYIERLELLTAETDDATKPKAPEGFKTINWVSWMRSF